MTLLPSAETPPPKRLGSVVPSPGAATHGKPAGHLGLLEESYSAYRGPFLLSGEEIAASLARFRRMRALAAAGKIEEARSVWWWPRSKEPPQEHYFETDAICVCPGKIPGARGSDGLCAYCGGHLR